jgi:hypothetical protein
MADIQSPIEEWNGLKADRNSRIGSRTTALADELMHRNGETRQMRWRRVAAVPRQERRTKARSLARQEKRRREEYDQEEGGEEETGKMSRSSCC